MQGDGHRVGQFWLERIKGQVARIEREVFGCPSLIWGQDLGQDLRRGCKQQNMGSGVIICLDDSGFVILEVHSCVTLNSSKGLSLNCKHTRYSVESFLRISVKFILLYKFLILIGLSYQHKETFS